MSKFRLKLSGSSRRTTLARKAIEMDGGGSEWEASDEEHSGSPQVSFDNYINSLEKSQQDTPHDNAIPIYSSEEAEMEDIVMDHPRKEGKSLSKYDASRKRKHSPKGEKVSFDDSDAEDPYKAFKNRKAVQRKRAAASTKRAKAQAKGASMVGKKQHSVLDAKQQRKKDYHHTAKEVSDDDEEELENKLPEYLKSRRGDFDRGIRKQGDLGLALPPVYEDIYFSDDERDTALETRPQFTKIKPQRPYQPIDLPRSGSTIPAPVAQYLRSYQIDGAAFMHEKFVDQKGCILGDDMGLGKTIQVIAFLTAAFGKTGDVRDSKRMRKTRREDEDRWYPRVLLICPGGLIANWKNELEAWGWWNVEVFHLQNCDNALAMATKGRLEIMITTYQTYTNHESQVNTVKWDCVICDEVHQAKGRRTATAKKLLIVNALCRIGLTGTAMQNKYEELYVLLNWANPGVLGSMASWKEKMCLPLKYGQAHGATNAQIAIARSTALKLRNNLLPRFFLRRPKTLIADELPKKTDRVVFCKMTDLQIEAYNTFCDSDVVTAMREANNPCDCSSGKKQGWCCYQYIDGEPWHKWVFSALHTLRFIAGHLALLLPVSEIKEKHDKEIEKLEMALPDMWKDLLRQKDSLLHFANTDFCGKWLVLRKLLHFWHSNGDKVLIFSYSVRFLKMLKTLFSSKTHYTYSYLDGSLSLEERNTVVDDFNSSPSQFVFLISTKAGGVGLNITSANKVVVMDPNWNPSLDLQAQDRAYRIGQWRDVDVFRLVSAGTIEEIVYARQIYKQQQASIAYNASVERRYFRGVQDQREMKGEIFGLANIFAPQSDNVVLQDIVNKTNIAESRAGVMIAGLDFEAAGTEDDDDENPFKHVKPEDGENADINALANSIIGDPDEKARKKAKLDVRTAKANAKQPAAVTGQQQQPKKDPVQAILASVGVEYTHNNAEVIGTSRMETKISSRAQKVGDDIDYAGQFAFVSSQPSAHDQRGGITAQRVYDDDVHDDDDRVKYRFRPDEVVRKRLFGAMARSFGFGTDVVGFGLVVEGWTQAQRRDALERWYGKRRVVLEEGDGGEENEMAGIGF
ncbi:hypothetical protein MBLNU230_g6199t1 [Neophaeotheca triangularis]